MKKARLIAIVLALIFLVGTIAGCGSNNAPSAPAGGGSAPAGGGSAPAGGGNAPAGGGSAPAGGGEQPSAPPTVGRDTAAPADTGQNFVLRIGTGTGGRHHQIIWMEAFKEAVEEATNGRIEVQLYPAGQLGTMAELVQGLVDGTVDAGVFPAGYFDIAVSAAGVIDLAFLFDDADQMWRILSNNYTMYQDLFESNGVIVGAWIRNFERTMITNTPVRSIDDIKGKVLWSLPSRAIHEEIRLLGGVSSGLDTGEVAPSVANGTLDGSVQDISLYFSQRLDQAGAKYMLSQPTGSLVSVYTMSQAWWNKLPAELRAIVLEKGAEVSNGIHRAYIDEIVETAYTVMVADGLEIIDPTPEFAAAMKAALAPQTDWFVGIAPDAGPILEEFQKLIAADR